NTTVLQWWDPLETMWRVKEPSPDYTNLNTDGVNFRLVNMSGVVSGVTIGAPGSGGTDGIRPVQTRTTASIAPPAWGGAPAQADAYVIIGGSVPAPTVVKGGQNFLVAPLVCCDPPPVGGRQATFTCQINAQGVITGVTQVEGGAGYLSVPQFYIIPQP